MSTPATPTLTLAVVLALVLAACGGGSDETTVAAPLPAASTFYDPGWIGAFGATVGGTRPRHLVAASRQDGGFFGVYGEEVATGFKAYGMLIGPGDPASNPSRYKGAGWDSDKQVPFMVDLTIDATVPAMSGTLTAGSEQRTVAGGVVPAVGYRFDLAASLASVAGHWELTTDRGLRIAMDVDSEGNITGRFGRCSIRDSKLAPTKTGYGVFAITLRFWRGIDVCDEPQGSSDEYFGFAVVYSPLAGGSQLVVGALGGWDEGLAATGKR